MRHLGDALARGAAPALKVLNLYGNPASDAAMRAIRSRTTTAPSRSRSTAPSSSRTYADAKKLDCSKLGWGDEEARRFAAALEHATAQGALKALETLDLERQQDRRRGDAPPGRRPRNARARPHRQRGRGIQPLTALQPPRASDAAERRPRAVKDALKLRLDDNAMRRPGDALGEAVHGARTDRRPPGEPKGAGGSVRVGGTVGGEGG